jgi:uncharacterized protein
MTAADYIKFLKLQRHPEGGYFRETYRSGGSIAAEALPHRFNGPRQFSTAIYFLLESGDYSAFHRIKSDECWHFYAGGPLVVHMINQNGDYEFVSVGNNLEKGEFLQFVVPAETWFASEPAEGTTFSLVGCTVMASGEALASQFPAHSRLIRRLSR